MTKLVLGRHGQCVYNAERRINGCIDSRPSRLGLRQAQELARWLGQPATRELVPFPSGNTIYTSPLLRARRTAQIVTGHMRWYAPQVFEPLKERHLGDVTGMTFEDAAALIAEEHKIRTAQGITYVEDKQYGFETFEEATEIGMKTVELAHSLGDEAVMWAFTHGDRMHSIAAAWTGVPMKDLIHEIHIPNTGLIVLDDYADYQVIDPAAQFAVVK